MKNKAFITIALLFFFRISSAFAYVDDVQASIDEAWQAALKVIQPAGIQKMNEKNKTMESKWMEDEVVRRNPLFKDITSQVYRRRYRMKISLSVTADNNVQILVKGDFEEKPKQSTSSAPWRKLKTEMQDYDLERVFFMRILSQMAKDHYRP